MNVLIFLNLYHNVLETEKIFSRKNIQFPFTRITLHVFLTQTVWGKLSQREHLRLLV